MSSRARQARAAMAEVSDSDDDFVDRNTDSSCSEKRRPKRDISLSRKRKAPKVRLTPEEKEEAHLLELAKQESLRMIAEAKRTEAEESGAAAPSSASQRSSDSATPLSIPTNASPATKKARKDDSKSKVKKPSSKVVRPLKDRGAEEQKDTHAAMDLDTVVISDDPDSVPQRKATGSKTPARNTPAKTIESDSASEGEPAHENSPDFSSNHKAKHSPGRNSEGSQPSSPSLDGGRPVSKPLASKPRPKAKGKGRSKAASAAVLPEAASDDSDGAFDPGEQDLSDDDAEASSGGSGSEEAWEEGRSSQDLVGFGWGPKGKKVSPTKPARGASVKKPTAKQATTKAAAGKAKAAVGKAVATGKTADSMSRRSKASPPSAAKADPVATKPSSMAKPSVTPSKLAKPTPPSAIPTTSVATKRSAPLQHSNTARPALAPRSTAKGVVGGQRLHTGLGGVKIVGGPSGAPRTGLSKSALMKKRKPLHLPK